MSNLTFVFKSGKEVTFDHIEEWTVSNDSEGNFVGLKIRQGEKRKRRIIVKSIDLKSIDCMYEH